MNRKFVATSDNEIFHLIANTSLPVKNDVKKSSVTLLCSGVQSLKGELAKVVGFNQFTLPWLLHRRPGPQGIKHCRCGSMF